MITYNEIYDEIVFLSNRERAQHNLKFFKTSKGEYGEGDKFLGITNPLIRDKVKKYYNIDLKIVDKFIESEFHEMRFFALLVLVKQFEKAKKDFKKQEQIYKYYLQHLKFVNNWDLVDLSAPNIVGNYLLNRDKKELYELAIDKSLWKRRVAIISTLTFIRNKKFDDAIKISSILLNDNEDLIHKAVGWVLREIGKRNNKLLVDYLEQNKKNMPRVMLRYAIEKFDKDSRNYFLNSSK